jgi:hypothetical protein
MFNAAVRLGLPVQTAMEMPVNAIVRWLGSQLEGLQKPT